MRVVGGIEAGGTKFVCAIGTGPGDIRAEARFPTTDPERTLRQVIDFFRSHREPVAAVGIGSFGPLNLDTASSEYGTITTSPKLAWRGVNIPRAVEEGLHVPVAVTTDVNAAAIGEYRWGAGRGIATLLYITVGTGIGGGVLVNGLPLPGVSHPEVGHVPLPHDRTADPFTGICPAHGDCLEGLASGPAVAARWGAPAETLAEDHPAWQLEAHYLALGLVAAVYVIAPGRILMGGGIMARPSMLPRIRAEVTRIIAGYVDPLGREETMETFIAAPALGARAGVLGAIAIALDTSQGQARGRNVHEPGKPAP